MRSTPVRTCSSALVAALVLSFSASAPAQSAGQNAQRAQTLFDEATLELDSGKYDVACPKLEEVTRLAPEGVGAKQTLAECLEKQGRLASAWRQHTAAEALARKLGKLDRAKESARAAAALEPRLSRITIVAPGAAPGLVIQLDGAKVEGDAPVFVDGGSHTVVASAPGYAPFSKTVAVAGEKARLDIKVPALQAQGSTSAPPAAPLADSAPPTAPPADSAAWRSGPRFVGGIAAAGLGVASVAVGIASSLQVSDAQAVLDEHRDQAPEGTALCAEGSQSALAPGDRERVKDACGKGVFVPLQFVFYGLGAALAGTGIYLLATSRPRAPEQSARASGGARPPAAAEVRVQPAAGPNGAWLSVVGRW